MPDKNLRSLISQYYRNVLQYLNYSRKFCLAALNFPHVWLERAYVYLFLPSLNPSESVIANLTEYDCKLPERAVFDRGIINCLQPPYGVTYHVLVPKKSILQIFYCIPRQQMIYNSILDINITVLALDRPVISKRINLLCNKKNNWNKVKINLSRVAEVEVKIAINLHFEEDCNRSTSIRDVLCYGPVLRSFKGFRNIASTCMDYLTAYGVKGLYHKIVSRTYDHGTEEISEKDYNAGDLFCNLLQRPPMVKDGSSMLVAAINVDYPIDIIIPIYNAYDHLVTCLRRVFNNSDIPARVILIDDCSTDPRIITLLEQYEQINFDNKNIKSVIIRRNSENCGFTKTVNLGLSMSIGHVVLLNSDVIVPPNWLSRLLKPIVDDSDSIASVTPFSNRATICSFPKICKDNDMYGNLEVDEIDSIFNRYAPCDWVKIPVGVGFCMAMNRKALNLLGGLDEIHFPRGYGEENDWCMRATKYGFHNVLTPRLFVEHDHGISWNSLGEDVRKNLIIKGLINLEKLHPGYRSLIQRFIDDDPIYPLRNLFISLTNTTHKRNQHNILILTSSLSGGSDAYLKDLIDVIAVDAQIFTCYYDVNTNSSVLTHFHRNGESVHYRVKNNMFAPYALKQICYLFSIDLIFVNHLLTFPNFQEILDALPVMKIPYVMAVHDYFSICYSWHLLDNNNEYCQALKDNHHCNECIREGFLNGMYYSSFGLTGNFDAGAWRSLWGQAYKGAKSVICFSISSRNILLEYYPFLSENIVVVPHLVTSPACGETCA